MKGKNANCSGYRIQAKWDNLNNVRHRAGRNFFSNRKGEYLKSKIIELVAQSKNKNIGDFYRGIN
jgi:hypothetical protein